MRVRILFILIATTLGLAGGAWAEVPVRLQYQGFLTDTSGTPLSGERNVSFSIYGSESGDDVNWTQISQVMVCQGSFSVLLGSETNPLDANVFSGSDLWLGITVGDGPELLPRMKVSAMPFAQQAGVSDNAIGDITPATVSVSGNPVIDADGKWVGDPSGLAGPKGEKGDTGVQGETGVAGDSVQASPADSSSCPDGGYEFSVGDSLSYFACNGAAGPQGEAGDQGEKGDQGIKGETGAAGDDGDRGLTCWDKNNNGTCDLTTEDTDDSGYCNAEDCSLNNSLPQCRDDYRYYKVDLPGRRICYYVENNDWGYTWNESASYCSGGNVAYSLCTYEQVKHLKQSNQIFYMPEGWLADRTADSNALYLQGWGDSTGQANLESELDDYYCCVEYRARD